MNAVSPLRVPVRTLDAARYADTFAVFVARSHEYAAMLDRLVEIAATLTDQFACLDVGAGTGMVIRDWLAREGRRPGSYVAIEPIPAHAAALRETMAELKVDGEVLEESYNARYPLPGSFDLALFSHSLYWMADPVECVRHTFTALRPGGAVLAFLQGPFGVHPLFRLFDPLLERDLPSGPDHGLSSHELVVGLRAIGFDPHVTTDPTPFDLTGLFDKGAEQERDEFLSFCLQIEFSELSEPLKSDAVEYLRNACVHQDGQLLWYEPTAAVTVRAASDGDC